MEDLIRERCGGKKLSEIETLNLAKASLITIDADVVNNCTNLLSLDVSQNQLKDLSGLSLPILQSLKFEDNSVSDLKFLSQLPLLESLYFDGNPLSVADRYIAVDQLPRLQTLDGKPCGEIQRLAKEFSQKLHKQGMVLYELKYEELIRQFPDSQEKNRCQKLFLRELLNKVSSCSGVPPSYMRYKVQNFIENLVKDVDTSITEALKELELSPPRSRRNTSPRKRSQPQDILKTPTKTSHTNEGLDVSPTKRSKVNDVERFLDFEPQLTLRVHSSDPQDSDTPVWCAAFEPDVADKRKTSDLVATCGGNVVCFTNCKSGHVLMKYKDELQSENFYALAWTVLPTGETKSHITVLAAGGTNKKIHLIVPSRKICYSAFKAHTQAIDTLHFHPINKTWLFSGGKDSNIHLWDIGVFQWSSHLKTNQKKLMTFDAGAEVLRLLVSPSYECLFAATDEGLMMWNLTGNMNTWTRNPSTNLIIPENCKSENSDVVDGMVLVSEQVMAIKVSQSGKIFLWDFSTMFSGRKLKKSRTFKMTPIVTFLWSDCSTDYIYIDCCPESGVLACGDNTGKIWIYDVEKYTKRNLSQVVENVQTPNAVFPWPKLMFEEEKMAVRQKIIINSVRFNWNGEYLVACTDSNLIPIWKRCEN